LAPTTRRSICTHPILALAGSGQNSIVYHDHVGIKARGYSPARGHLALWLNYVIGITYLIFNDAGLACPSVYVKSRPASWSKSSGTRDNFEKAKTMPLMQAALKRAIK
jgi:hypothetical protein